MFVAAGRLLAGRFGVEGGVAAAGQAGQQDAEFVEDNQRYGDDGLIQRVNGRA